MYLYQIFLYEENFFFRNVFHLKHHEHLLKMGSKKKKVKDKNFKESFSKKFTAVSQITIVCGGIIERIERKHSSSNCA